MNDVQSFLLNNQLYNRVKDILWNYYNIDMIIINTDFALKNNLRRPQYFTEIKRYEEGLFLFLKVKNAP
jgi:hypothetical protein